MEEKCLVCGGELEIDDMTDTEFDGETMYAHIIGYCTECGCPHKWTDVFKFAETKDLKIDEDFLNDDE